MRFPADRLPDHFYASAVRDDLWLVHAGEARLLEEHRETGFAICHDQDGINQIDAADQLDRIASHKRGLIGVDPAELTGMLHDLVDVDESAFLNLFRQNGVSVRTRVVRRARYVSTGRFDDAQVSSFVVASAQTRGAGVSIVSTEENIHQHLHLLTPPDVDTNMPSPQDRHKLPFLWSNGSASVLLHELIGHPGERGLEPAGIPDWLTVVDRPSGAGLGSMRFDDCGTPASDRLLSAGELPSCFRRESFRAVPLRRMTNLQAEVAAGAPPIDLPARFIAVKIVGKGGFDPLTDRIRLSIDLADLVDGESVTRLAPFEIERSRTSIARLIRSAEGPPIEYPGVLCHEDGQRLPVGSAAPLLVTDTFERND